MVCRGRERARPELREDGAAEQGLLLDGGEDELLELRVPCHLAREGVARRVPRPARVPRAVPTKGKGKGRVCVSASGE